MAARCKSRSLRNQTLQYLGFALRPHAIEVIYGWQNLTLADTYWIFMHDAVGGFSISVGFARLSSPMVTNG